MPAEAMIPFFNYFLASAVSYLGLACGAALAFIAPEELSHGRYYLLWLKRAMFVAIFVAFIYYSPTKNLLFSVLLLVLSALFIRYSDGHVFYIILGLLFYLSSSGSRFFLTIASMIFLFGLPTGTLFADKRFLEREVEKEKNEIKSKKKDIKNEISKKEMIAVLKSLLLHHLLFFAVALPLYFSNL